MGDCLKICPWVASRVVMQRKRRESSANPRSTRPECQVEHSQRARLRHRPAKLRESSTCIAWLNPEEYQGGPKGSTATPIQHPRTCTLDLKLLPKPPALELEKSVKPGFSNILERTRERTHQIGGPI